MSTKTEASGMDGDGKPINIEAAALDAMEWVKLLRQLLERSRLKLAQDAIGKMNEVILEVEKRATP